MFFKHLPFVLLWYLIRPSAEVNFSHPKLYFSTGDVAKLRQQSHTTHYDIFARLHQAADEIKRSSSRYVPPRQWNEFAGKWNEAHGNNFGALAMYCVLNDTDSEARHIALQFFVAFASLPNWRVKASIEDDVPVAHSLVAVATAYDFMYHYLDGDMRSVILRKIHDVTKELYERSFKLGWGEQYIQNHVATNYAALLTGALVLEQYNVEAKRWMERAHEMLNRTMFLLSHVKDGSLDEGVAYGSYTTRSLTQYIFLAKRHWNVDLTDNVWLREHFWFLYRTILPGFYETIGIGDSNTNWFYGPESQLVFLDNFVMRNGYGNWLASKIRNSELREVTFSQRYCTLHTEFVFYDPSIPEKEPPEASTPKLHVFDDWGVATYGGGTVDSQSQSKKSTFLSFKASVLHGKAVNNMVKTRPYSWIRGWHSFNPGHEHPDQGSFVFVPNGVPFITEALYGPKYTWLDNVLLFGPTRSPTCSGNYEGQIGECGKWLDFKNAAVWQASAELMTASEVGGMVFMSGEISKWYNSYLGLTSVYRAVVLLNPGVLLVIDLVRKTPESPARYVGAFFHNRKQSFELRQGPVSGPYATIKLNGETYQVFWTKSKASRSVVRCQSAKYGAEVGLRKTHFLNVTTTLNRTQTALAYVFVAPGNTITRPRLDDKENGCHVSFEINGIAYNVSTVANYTNSEKRRDFIGFDGFAKVVFGEGNEVRFGTGGKAFYQHVSKHVARGVRVLSNILIVFFVWISVLFLFLSMKGVRRNLFKSSYRGYQISLVAGIILLWTASTWWTRYVNEMSEIQAFVALT